MFTLKTSNISEIKQGRMQKTPQVSPWSTVWGLVLHGVLSNACGNAFVDGIVSLLFFNIHMYLLFQTKLIINVFNSPYQPPYNMIKNGTKCVHQWGELLFFQY